MALVYLLALTSLVVHVSAQLDQILGFCGLNNRTLCIKNYATVLPRPFNRTDANTNSGSQSIAFLTIGNTSLTPIFDAADFVSYDNLFFTMVSNATYDFKFLVSTANHEAPVFLPDDNKIIFSELPPHAGTDQLVIDLEDETLSNITASPEVNSPNGGTFSQGLVYWALAGRDETDVPSITTYNFTTNIATEVVNNYFGINFNSLDDITISNDGNIVLFTDPFYGFWNQENAVLPTLPPATYSWNKITGAVKIIDASMIMPNGIVFSPDNKIVYITDTGNNQADFATDVFTHSQRSPGRAIYSFSWDGNNLSDKKLIYLSDSWLPDGIKMDSHGNIWTAAGFGVDVLDPNGRLLGKILTNYTTQNLVFSGPTLSDLWIFGNGGVSKISNLKVSGKPVV